MADFIHQQLSSITLKANAKGGTTPELKIYCDPNKPELMLNAAKELWEQILKFYVRNELPPDYIFTLSPELQAQGKFHINIEPTESSEWKTAKAEAAQIVNGNKNAVPKPGADPFKGIPGRDIGARLPKEQKGKSPPGELPIEDDINLGEEPF